jgi:hypothetical protein
VRAGAVPNGVLLGAGEHGDGLGEFGIRGQRSVRRLVGAQDVGQHEGVPGVGLFARHRVPISISGHRQRVDREHFASGRAQACNQQAAAGLDGDRDRLLAAVAGGGEHLQQRGEPGGVVADAAFGHQLALGVDQGDVVMVFGPVDATEHSQDLVPPLMSWPSVPVRGGAGTRERPNGRARGPTSHQPFVTPADRRRSVFARARSSRLSQR